MRNLAIVRTVGVLVVGSIYLWSASSHAAKPSGGGKDPCAEAGLDFPAFVYRAVNGKTQTIYVTDTMGKCRRPIVSSSAIIRPKFSYPISGTTDTGRVVFLQGGFDIYSVDFKVGTGNTITAGQKKLLLTAPGCCALDLSSDGQTVYFSETDTSLAKAPVAGPFSPERIYERPASDPSWYFALGSVNGDETQFFATKSGLGENAGGSRLVRIDLTNGTEHVLREWLPQDGYGANPFWPAADKTQARIAFNEYIPNTNNCTPLTVTDYDGNELFPASFTTERPGRDPTWVGDDVVMLRRTPMDGSGKCSTTTSLSMIDVESNSETVLLTGYDPDGR